MRIVVFGTGAVGGYFGGRLAQAGMDVTFIDRGRQLQAIEKHGLRVDSINGDFSIHEANATDDSAVVGKADVVLCCVKSWQVSEAAMAMRPCWCLSPFARDSANAVAINERSFQYCHCA